MALSVKKLDPSKEILCDRLSNVYDPQLQFTSVNISQSTLSSLPKGQLEMLNRLKLSLVGFALEPLPHFQELVQWACLNYSSTKKSILDNRHSCILCQISPEEIKVSLNFLETQSQSSIAFSEADVVQVFRQSDLEVKNQLL